MNQNATVKPILTLGTDQNDTQLALEMFVEKRLIPKGLAPEISRFPSQEAALRAVADGKIAAYTCPLHLAPLDLPMGLVITALTERTTVDVCLVARGTEQIFGERVIFSNEDTPSVWTLSDLYCAQIKYLYPNFKVEKTDLSPDNALKAVKSGACDAVVLAQSDVNAAEFINSYLQIQMFSTREFIPSAGQGTACFITAEDDLPTRRLLQNIHDPSVSAVTNIERTVQKLLKDYEICAHCVRDRMGNYHLWAAALLKAELVRTRVSQSTSYGLGEKAVEQLFSA